MPAEGAGHWGRTGLAKPKIDMAWLDHIELKPDRSLGSEAAIVKTLRRELTEALTKL